MYRAGPEQRAVSLFGPDGEAGIQTWWQEAKQLPWYARHHAAEVKHTVGFLIHHDGCEIHNATEFETWNMRSVHASKGSVYDRVINLVMIEKSMMHDEQLTQTIIAKFFAWSFSWALVKLFPTRGFQGEAFERGSHRAQRAANEDFLADGIWGATCVGFESDNKARAAANDFDRYYRCTHLCDICLACQPFKKADKRMTYQNFNPDAPWRLSEFHHDFYTMVSKPSPWFELGLTIEMVYFDIAHNLYLGKGGDACPSWLRSAR